MKIISAKDIIVPLDVPRSMREEYIKNYLQLTHNTGNLMLFAGDQKIEHLNKDFYGKGIAIDDADPIHLFTIASKAHIGVFATQMGLIARYGNDFGSIPYMIKINSKTNLVTTEPISASLIDIHQIVTFKKNSGLNILAVGYTVYLGSEYEGKMLREASQIIYSAHQYGMIAVIWAYPRGKSVVDEKNPRIIAGASGVAACLGADFVKVNMPNVVAGDPYESLKEAVLAAGRTKVVCAGGSAKAPIDFLHDVYSQIHIGGTAGNATGRNIHQKPLEEAVQLTNAVYTITIEGKTLEEAIAKYHGNS